MEGAGTVGDGPDAEPLQHIQGHVHIAPGFQRRGEEDVRVALQQGEGIEKAGDKLAGHIAWEGITPRR